MLKSFKAVPHVLMFTGAPGTGKTTLARVMAGRVGCDIDQALDFAEVNCGVVESAIDTVREIGHQMSGAPLAGKARVWILDECFHPNTPLSVFGGVVPIGCVVVGTRVRTVAGWGVVERVFRNRVPLERVTRVDLDDGGVVFTSSDHDFLTDTGWKSAASLRVGDCFFGEPSYESGSSCEGEKDEGGARDSSRLAGGTGRQREDNPRTSRVVRFVGGCGTGVGVGAIRIVGEAEGGDADQLQVGYRRSETAGSDRGGRSWTQDERRYCEGQQENPMSRRVGVVGVAVYQRGSNELAFRGGITDQDRYSGFVEFVDLQVGGHPSYFAAGVPVHNCQAFGRFKYAQEALLKILEETPPHVYFFLCTTDPRKIIAAVRSRCTEIPVKPIPPKELRGLLADVAAKERVEVSAELLDKIVANAAGSARNALKELGRVVGIEDDEERIEAVGPAAAERAAFDLVKALIPFRGRPVWRDVAAVLTDIADEEPEGLRHMVLASARTALLKTGNPNCYTVIDCLREPLFDANSGRAILAARCFEIVSLWK